MILQTKASSLIALIAKDSGEGSLRQAICDAILAARDEAKPLLPSNTVSNDRTTLPHQQK